MSDPNVPPQPPAGGPPPAPHGAQVPPPAAPPQGVPGQVAAQPGPPPYGPPSGQADPAAYGAPGPQAPYGAAPHGSPSPYGAPTGQVPVAQVPRRPAVNPFKGIATGDFVRDGVAVLVLLLSLSLPWDWQGSWADDGRSRSLVEVLLITLLSVISVAVPYVARAGVFPATWTVAHTRWLRIGLNAPYVVLVVIYLILGLVSTDDQPFGANITIGTGMALGLAGALLAAQPRDHELDAQTGGAVASLWRLVLTVIGGAIALGYLASLVWLLVDLTKNTDSLPVVDTIGMVIQLLGAAALALTPVVMVVLKGSRPWRRALLTVATSLTVVFFFGSGDGSTLPSFESLRAMAHSFAGGVSPWSTWVGLGTLLVPAAAAVASSSAVTRTLTPLDDARSWIGSAAAELWLVAGIAVLAVVSSVTLLAGELSDYVGSTAGDVTTIILGLAVAGAAVWAALQLQQETVQARFAGTLAVGIAFVLGIVILAVAPGADSSRMVSAGHLLLAFGLPAGALIALYGPRPVREAFASQRAATVPAGPPAWQGGQPPAPQPHGAPPVHAGLPVPGAEAPPAPSAPTPPPPFVAPPTPVETAAASPDAQQQPQDEASEEPSVPPAPAPEGADHVLAEPGPGAPESSTPAPPPPAPVTAQHGFTLAVTSDPATPAATLAQIVEVAPELRAAVAANPATYPALLDWLALLKDPAIDAALAARRP